MEGPADRRVLSGRKILCLCGLEWSAHREWWDTDTGERGWALSNCEKGAAGGRGKQLCATSIVIPVWQKRNSCGNSPSAAFSPSPLSHICYLWWRWNVMLAPCTCSGLRGLASKLHDWSTQACGRWSTRITRKFFPNFRTRSLFSTPSTAWSLPFCRSISVL